MSSDPKPRLVPNLVVLLFLLAHVAVLAWLQLSDGAGDQGMNNVFSYMATMMIVGVYGIWFLGFSGQPKRRRAWAAGLALGLAADFGAGLATGFGAGLDVGLAVGITMPGSI